MSTATIEIAFFASLAFALVVGGSVLFWWSRRVFTRISARLTDPGSRGPVGMQSTLGTIFVRMLPGIGLFVLCCVPVLYFGGLRKQELYCLELIRVNRITNPDNADLRERCGSFDRPALLQRVQSQR